MLNILYIKLYSNQCEYILQYRLEKNNYIFRNGRENKIMIEENTVKAENQVKKEQMVFWVGDEHAANKVAIVGNSITRHGIMPEIGWKKLCGMAASKEECDYVHVLYRRLSEEGFDSYFMVNQLSYWEMNYYKEDNIVSNYCDIKEFQPNYLIFRLGENIVGDGIRDDLQTQMEELLQNITTDKTKVIMTTCFWKNKKVDEVIRKIACEHGYPVVELGDLGELDEMKAIGEYEHTGVAAHPGDKGMTMIAERILQVLKK